MSTLRPPSLLDRSPFLKATVGSGGNLILSVAVLIVAALLAPPLIRWLLIDATFTGTAESCKAASGACWAFVGEKLKFIVLGFYPQDQASRASVTSVAPPFRARSAMNWSNSALSLASRRRSRKLWKASCSSSRRRRVSAL